VHEDQSFPSTSDECNSEISNESLSPGTPDWNSLSEKRGGSTISSRPLSANSSATSAARTARRSKYSNANSESLVRKESLASPLREPTVHRSSEREAMVPVKAKAASRKVPWQSNSVPSSAHLRRISNALPESIMLPPDDVEWMHRTVERMARKYKKTDQKLLEHLIAVTQKRNAIF
jgi:hypothetical protein